MLQCLTQHHSVILHHTYTATVHVCPLTYIWQGTLHSLAGWSEACQYPALAYLIHLPPLCYLVEHQISLVQGVWLACLAHAHQMLCRTS